MAKSYIKNLKNYVGDAQIIFEIGAFDGMDVNEIKSIWNNSRIHCFEPDPESFEILKTYAGDTVICNNFALSNVVGEITFNKYFDSLTTNQDDRDTWFKQIQSLRKMSKAHIDIGQASHRIVEKEIIVDCTTLDAYCLIEKVSPDILLIDTQGSEWEILDGAREILPNVKGILVEWSRTELYQGQKLFQDIINLLTEYNFKMVEELYQVGKIHGDAIFIKNK